MADAHTTRARDDAPRRALHKGDRLPTLTLPAVHGAADIPLRVDTRQATVLLAVHGDCTACAAFAERLAAERDAFREWDGRLVVAVCGRNGVDLVETLGSDSTVAVAADPEERLRAAGIGAPTLLIADQWGEIFAADDAGTDHDWPAVDEVTRWLRYLAVQCPECQGEAL